VDPGGRAGYERRAAPYRARLRALDERIAACLRRVPGRTRKLVTTHDSLAYLARRYRIEQVGTVIPARSTQAQPSARHVERLVDRIRAEDVPVVFPERGGSTKLERAVAREADVELGKPLFTDALGGPGSPGDTYLRATAWNARALAAGMSGGQVRCRV
jgi:ABC-type Zn uptake system ZnuABC Zn-binding protein ZnuA